MRSRVRGVVSVAAIAVAFSMLWSTPAIGDDARKLKQQVPPIYPELAKSNHITGAVKLEIVISPQGSVRSVKVMGGNPVLADAAERAVKNWKYESGEEETRTITVEFKQ